MKCPECDLEQPDDTAICSGCGLSFEMWRKHMKDSPVTPKEPTAGTETPLHIKRFGSEGPVEKPVAGAEALIRITRFGSSDFVEKPAPGAKTSSPSPQSGSAGSAKVPAPKAPEKKPTPGEKVSNQGPRSGSAGSMKEPASKPPEKKPVPAEKVSSQSPQIKSADSVEKLTPASEPPGGKKGFKWTPIRSAGLGLVVILAVTAFYFTNRTPPPVPAQVETTPVPTDQSTSGTSSTPSDITPTVSPFPTSTPVMSLAITTPSPAEPAVPVVPVKAHPRKHIRSFIPTPTHNPASEETTAATPVSPVTTEKNSSGPASAISRSTPTEEPLPVYSAEEAVTETATPSPTSIPVSSDQPESTGP